MTFSCDILIVGGGPSGSTLAWALRESGMKVMLIDKQAFPRDKVCAGWITPPIIDALELDIAEYGNERVMQPITGFNVRQIDGAESKVRYGGETVSYGIRRCEFDHYLLNRSGVDARTDIPVKRLEHKQDHWLINDTIKTPLLIGAGGHFCPVARQLGANPGLSEVAVAAQEIEFMLTQEQRETCDLQAEIPELFFCKDMKGYGWIFRKGNYLNIGMGREDQRGLSHHVSEFCRYLQSIGKLPAGIEDRFKGHAYLLYGHAVRRMADNGALLIGDAAGLAYTRSGEGIRPAIESALLAASIIKQAKGDYSISNLGQYVDLITARFGARPSTTFADVLPEAIKRTLATTLLSTEMFVRNIVIDRWFLHRYEAPLIVTSNKLQVTSNKLQVTSYK